MRPLTDFARSLARPVRAGWLTVEIADAALLLAADRSAGDADLVATWRDLQSELRAELATEAAA